MEIGGSEQAFKTQSLHLIDILLTEGISGKLVGEFGEFGELSYKLLKFN